MKNKKISRLCSRVFIFTGTLCILTSLSLYTFAYIEDFKKYEEFKNNSHVFQNIIPSEQSLEDEEEIEEEVEIEINDYVASSTNLFSSDNIPEKEFDIETIIINGEPYIGVIKIDSINLSLPIHETWTDAKLDTAPCVYSGSLPSKNLIVGGHNTNAHFGSLNTLEVGATAVISDANGKEYNFVLKEFAVISETEVRILENIKKYELTLFTCDSDSRKRLVQRWSLV